MNKFEQVLQENKEDYYSVNAISNTAIGYFLESPLTFHKFMTSGGVDKTPSMELGSVIHSYLLERNKFNEQYTVCKNKVNGKMGQYIEAFVDVIVTGVDESVAHEIAYQKAEFNPRSIKPETVINNFSNFKERTYMEFLKKSIGKTVIGEDIWDIAEKCISSIKDHKFSKYLLTSPIHTTCFNELEIYWKINKLDLKSKLDRLVIDWDNKKIMIIDLKSNSNKVKNFKDSVIKYGIYRQLAFYRDAVTYWLKDKEDLKDALTFDIECYIIAVETTGYNETRVFKLNENDLFKGQMEVVKVLNDIETLEKMGTYTYPVSYYENDGVVELLIFEEENDTITKSGGSSA